MRSFLVLAALIPVLNAFQVNLQWLAGRDANDKLLIRYEIENDSYEPLSVLKHNTPFEIFRDTLVGNPFEIIFQETHEEPVYLGIMMKHAEPTEDDYMIIPPGEKLSTVIDLRSAYLLNAKGSYLVRPVDTGLGFHASNELAITLDSGDDFLVQPQFPEPVPVNMTDMVNCGVPTILGNCNSGDQTAIRNSWTRASQCMPSLPVYSNPNPGDANTNRWMGGGGTGLSGVQSGLQRAQQLMCRQGSFGNGARASCDYGCSAYAYVYPSDSTFTIYLCSVYFRAPATGRDSQFGTVIHEAVHFNPIHAARDVQYGCQGCQTLARNNPNGARGNSDSIEFLNEFSGYFTPVPSC